MEENLNKKINKKKIIIIALIALILLGISIFTVFFINKKYQKTSKTYFIDNTFNITIDNKYNLNTDKISNTHIFELHSKNNFNIYIDKIENLDNYSLLLIAKGDKNYFPSTLGSISNISEISETTINNFPIVTYSFEYLDNNINQQYYVQIYFIKINNKIYSIDVEFPVSETETFLPITSNILSTINTNIK